MERLKNDGVDGKSLLRKQGITSFPQSDWRNREISISAFQKCMGLWVNSQAIDVKIILEKKTPLMSV